MESDVLYPFLEDLKRRKEPQVSMADIQKDPMAFASNFGGGGGSGPKMMFVHLTMNKAEELGKEGTEVLSKAWSTMLFNGGVNANLYATDPWQILVVTTGPGLPARVKEFVFQQEGVDYVEQDNQRSYPPGRTKPKDSDEYRKKRGIELGWRSPDKAWEDTPKKKGKAKGKKAK